MKPTRIDIEGFMSRVSAQIRAIEADLEPVWFDFDDRPLSWATFEPNGRKRLLLGEKPLIEHKFETRLEHVDAAKALREKCLAAARERMEQFQ